MRRLPLLLVFTCITLVACSVDMSVRARTEAEQELQTRVDDWVRAMNNMDLAFLATMHHRVPELKVIWPDGRVAHGWDEEQALYQQATEGVDRINFGVQNVEIEVLTRDIALVTFRHSTDIIREDGERGMPTAGSVTIVWVKDAGEWKIHLEHHSVRPPSAN
jgi:ketosteroid isomerase-like protein